MTAPEKFPLVDNMRRYGGNFVSRLADAMVAADPENYGRLCLAFPAIVNKFCGDDDQPLREAAAPAGFDLHSIEEEGLPTGDHRDLQGRAWFGHGFIADPETGEPYAPSWSLRDEPYGSDTHWASADSLPIAR